MRFDMRELPFGSCYKIMNSTITPRPIAWTVTLDDAGTPNAAPHSFFNALGSAPPMVVLGLMKVGGVDKDSAAYIRARRDFVVALVGEHDAERMNLTATDSPRGVDELALAEIETAPASVVAPPLIVSAPVCFECRTVDLLDYAGQTVVIAEVLVTHIRDEFVLDEKRMHLDTPAMKLIARTHGAGWYQRGSDQFQMHRSSWADLQGGAAG
ncbi:flavin reductase family protein [Sphingomonas jatrophae]|uniref:NADH-FMN oxidoreductase RutF, flavin reductase (DIM6/NTAB) family n=1 Tax=Sphingomonas jatrophae TaxID=1166337 RepID=A0A1I6KEM9_9SPHN|nr:flavin reductase family protein [Sphingomonas jatrophae]SFR89330.1 NADH-FMN oxidoreductase RutF, flavin reductase (DIM6/NTAB) family [Sphingomonas jatrophae]